MAPLELHLLGRFEAHSAGVRISSLEGAARPRELLCFLLLFPDRPHYRETLCDALWGEASGGPRKHLRQALWQLQVAMKRHPARSAEPLLEVEPEWVRISPDADVSVDVEELESAFASTRGTPGEDLSAAEAARLSAAAGLYRGELLQGWYQEWCTFERERLKAIYLAILDKLLAYSEVTGAWDDGLEYGSSILRYDRAHERTHWRLMRLHYLSGNRTAAVRQYGACVSELQRALGIGPGEQTNRLFEDICADRMSGGRGPAIMSVTATRRMLSHMRQVKQSLAYTEGLLEEDIADIENTMGRSAGPAQP
jgi:DNA-binding SARP family transcriptional activator